MRLQSQLLLVSLAALSLPWASYKSLRAFDNSLRHQQVNHLQAQAQAIAALLPSNAIPPERSASTSTPSLFAHPLASEPIVDGYADDWEGYTFEPAHFKHRQTNSFSAAITVGTWQQALFILLDIEDSQLEYLNLTGQQYRRSDQLQLYSPQWPAPLIISASAPGKLQAFWWRAPSELEQPPTLEREQRISGVWRESEQGYRLELNLPAQLRPTHLGWRILNFSGGQTLALGNINSAQLSPWQLASTSPALTYLNHELTAQAQNLVSRQQRLYIADRNGWLIAKGVGENAPEAKPRWLMQWLYQHTIAYRPKRNINTPSYSGQLDGEVVSLSQQAFGLQRHINPDTPLTQVSQPLFDPKGRITGMVLLQEPANLGGRHALLNAMRYGLLATLITMLALVGYGLWLSRRIRQLSQAAHKAMDQQGTVSSELPQSHRQDELGELSRNYSTLLHRIDEYTQYLQTLASKLSHEMRTPIAVIKSSLDNLDHELEAPSHDALSPHVKQYSQRARAGAEQLSQILSAMSSAKRIEEAISQAEQESIQLSDLLHQLCQAYDDSYAEHQIVWCNQLSDAEPAFMCSPELLVQMLDKLVDNACDFAPHHTDIHISLAQTETMPEPSRPTKGNTKNNRKAMRIRVTNPGPELTQDMAQHIFDPLVSLRQTEQDQDQQIHLGLGLQIVRLIVEFHQGQVRALNLSEEQKTTLEPNHPPQGVCIEIYLPISP